MRIRGPALAVLSAAAIVAVGITSSIPAHAEQMHLKKQVVIPAPAAIDQQTQFVIPQAFDIAATTVKDSGHFMVTALGEQPYVDVEEAITHRMQAARIGAADHTPAYAWDEPRGLQDDVTAYSQTTTDHYAELATNLATIYGGMTSYSATAAEPGTDHSALRGGIKDEVPESDFFGGIKFGEIASAYTHQ